MTKAKDLKLMKVIHDIKSPMLSIKQIVNSIEVSQPRVNLKDSNSLLSNHHTEEPLDHDENWIKTISQCKKELKTAIEALKDTQRQIN